MTYYEQRRAELLGDRQRKPRRDSQDVLQATEMRERQDRLRDAARAAAARLARILL